MWPFKPKQQATGLVHNQEQHEDPRNLSYVDMIFGAAPLPESGSVLERSPYIVNQWSTNSCTAQAAMQAFYLLSGKKPSARHAYWKIKTDPSYPSSAVSYGAYLKDPFVAMIKGVADYDVVPNPSQHMNDTEYLLFVETSESVASAIKNAMGGAYVFPTTAGGSQAIFDATVRYMSDLVRPVVLGIDWYPEYNNARKGGVLPLRFPTGEPLGHAICAVRWKTINGEPYIGCVNSWGKEWGDEGLVWIPRKYTKIYTAIGWIPPEVKKELHIKTETVPIENRDEAKERANAQELQAFVDLTFPPVGDAKLNTQNSLAHSIFAREKVTIVKAVCYLGWTFRDVVNYLNARSRGKTTTKAYSLDFTKPRNI